MKQKIIILLITIILLSAVGFYVYEMVDAFSKREGWSLWGSILLDLCTIALLVSFHIRLTKQQLAKLKEQNENEI